uniref:Uncharacterized protein n=1 Tax=Arundo donax TaxID=35708 RepID=A0A0A9C2M5_ARUDO
MDPYNILVLLQLHCRSRSKIDIVHVMTVNIFGQLKAKHTNYKPYHTAH